MSVKLNLQAGDWITAVVPAYGMKGNDGSTERVAGHVISLDPDDTCFVRAGERTRLVRLDNPTLTKLPAKPREDAILISFFGITEWMIPVGKGAYPYDCKAKDKYPDAMVYENGRGGWTTDRQLRLTKNGFYTTR